MSEIEEDRLWTKDDVARYFRVKPGTVYTWVQHGKIPYIKIGHTLRFEPQVVKNWALGSTPAPAVQATHLFRSA